MMRGVLKVSGAKDETLNVCIRDKHDEYLK